MSKCVKEKEKKNIVFMSDVTFWDDLDICGSKQYFIGMMKYDCVFI